MGKDTSQNKRLPDALHPDYFKVDERSLEDLYLEAQKLADALIFYESSEEKGNTSWSAFFDEAGHYLRKITSGEWKADLSQQDPGNCPPHLGLLMAFLELFGHTQNQLNNLTAGHLHFFYQKILLQKKKGVIPDKVYVFFSLARNIEKYLLPRHTALLAGKDNQGTDIIYTTDRDLFLHNAKIVKFKAIHHQKISDSSIFAFPIADSMDGFGNYPPETQGWYPFGNTRIAPLSAKIGYGIASPMLFLKEGSRTVSITFSLVEKSLTTEINSLKAEEFEAQFTTKEQWFTRAVKEVQHQDGKLTFIIHLNNMDPPVSGFDESIHDYPIGTIHCPLLKILLRQGYTYSRYAFIQSLQFSGIQIKVAVENTRSLLLRNDYGDLDAKKAFQPFGYSPVLGANLYLGLEEIFFKPITSYTININWKGLPEDFKAYYEGYQGPTNSLVRTNEDFKVKAAIKYEGEWIEAENKAADSREFPLFSGKLQLNADEYPRENAIPYQQIKREDGLIRLTLSSPPQAFGHTVYPTVYARAIMDQLQEKPSPIPHEPYTPIIDNIGLSYTAEEEIDFTNTPGSFRYFHIKPFGINEKFNPAKKPDSSKILSLLSGEFHHAGILFMGIENLHPPQQLILFFDIAEEKIQDKPDLIIHYLNETGWRRLPENQVLSDTTLGLKQTGILSMNIPADAASKNPGMPLGYHWIRVSVPENPENFDRIISVRTNAVTCTLNNAPSLSGLEVNKLPPGTVKRFYRKIAEIKQIEQPYSSFGGRPAENDVSFFTRVSEKLRHKMRGITSWDIERLILEKFPEIYKVKCIPHTEANGMPTPGHFHIIVIPLIKQYEYSKILKPMVPNSTLVEIKEFIARMSSPHAAIEVTHPHFEEIKIDAVVNFNIQVDAGFYLKQLQSDLQYFLSPWAFQEDAEIQLGNKLYRSSIIEYIESRHYVNFIASIRLLKNNKVIQDHEISPDERSIIVSADKHDIKSISSERVVCQTNQGIEQMIIDINFEIQ